MIERLLGPGPLPAFRFDEPRLLLVLVLLIPLVLLLPRARFRNAPTGQRFVSILLRLAIVTLLAFALALPVAGYPRQSLSVVFGLDVSESISAQQEIEARAWIERAVQALGPDSEWAVVEFGERAHLSSLTPDAQHRPPAAGTDLESALRLMGSVLPRDGAREIVLLSDGWENLGEAAAVGVVPDGVVVSFVNPSKGADAPEVSLRSVEIAPAVRVGESLETALTIESTVPAGASVRMLVDDRVAVEQFVELRAGVNFLTISPRVRTPGFHHVRIEVSSEADSRTENNALDAVTVAHEPGRVLVLEERPGEGAQIAATLVADGMHVDLRPSTSIPPNPSSLREFDSVVLVDVSATGLSLDQQQTLQLLVREEGRGLVAIGGPHAYALGGYEDTVLDEILPVSAKPPVNRQEGSVALFLVVDKSSSMDLFGSEGSKMQMAREAALLSTDLLKPGDTLGVVGFDNRWRWVVEPVRLENEAAIDEAQAKIATISADGGTDIAPALEAAYQAAAQVDARLKHIVLLTDGQSSDADYAGMISQMRPYQITLSTVAVGSDADTKLLDTLARLGEGRYYFTERPSEIPRITSKETEILTRNAVIEGPISALVDQPSPLLRGLSGDFPVLQGYVAVTPKPRAITALISERGHPLLAHWQYGVGRTVAWTSDVQGPWSPEWVTWNELARFWSQAMRWAMPAPGRADFQVAARVDGRTLSLQAESLDDSGRFADHQDTRATVVTPDGVALEVALPQTGPGTYALSTEVAKPGAYRVVFTQRDNEQIVREEVTGFAVAAAPELRTIGVNRPLLEQLAERSGGRELFGPSDLLTSPNRVPTEERVPLWPYVVAAALALLPFDIAVRRLRWPRLLGGGRT